MKVMLLTSVPMSPPWDQGDKNFAYSLTQALPDVQFRVLSTVDNSVPVGGNLDIRRRYHTRTPSILEKTAVYLWLLWKPFAESRYQPNGTHDSKRPDAPPDLYHLVYRPLHLSTWMSRLLPDFRRRPTIQTIPATADEGPMQANLFFADQIVAQSEYGLQRIQRAGITDVLRIPPGIATNEWSSLAHQQEYWKNRLQLDPRRPVLLFPGHYGSGQGADILTAALPDVLRMHPGTQVLFACRLRTREDRRLEIQTKKLLASQGLADYVHHYNTVTDMRPLIGASDIVLLPLQTMRDKVDIPITLLEAMAAGKPFIISDIPPMNELVHRPELEADHPPGLHVQPGDHPGLSSAINKLLDSPKLRRQMGDAGLKTVRSQYEIRSVAQRYKKLYNRLLT